MQVRASAARGEGPGWRPGRRVLEALAFSSVLPGLVAVVLLLAAARSMGLRVSPAMEILAFSGTLVVYNLDRLRDLQRDRQTAPVRTQFVERHRGALGAASALAALAAVASAVVLGPGVCLLCGVVLSLGLVHRRIKHVPILKGLYVTTAWLAVVVGVPAIATGTHGNAVTAWTAAVIGAALLANIVASSLRDTEAGPARSPRAALVVVRVLPVLGVAAALLGPAPVRSLAWIPGVLALALWRGPRGEHYGHIAVDGALLVGALAALLL